MVQRIFQLIKKGCVGVKKIAPLILFISGIYLVGLNIYGLFKPLKNPEIYSEENTGFENDSILSPKETFVLLSTLDRNNTKEFVYSTNNILNKSIAHYWSDDGLQKYNITIPYSENWILSLLQYIVPSIYKRYEYCSYKKIIERGVGLCSQHAIALVDYLNNNGVNSKIVGLDGHVVATVDVGDEWWIFDPDYGVVIPYDIQFIENNPEIVKEYYEGKLGNNRDYTEEKISNIYEMNGNRIYPSSLFLGTVYGYTDCNWKKVIIEKISYIFIWVVPVIMTLPYLKRPLVYEKFFKKENKY